MHPVETPRVYYSIKPIYPEAAIRSSQSQLWQNWRQTSLPTLFRASTDALLEGLPAWESTHTTGTKCIMP